MQFTQETGNNLLLEWYADNTKLVEIERQYFIDRTDSCQILIGFDEKRTINICKVYNNFHEFSETLKGSIIKRDRGLVVDPFDFSQDDEKGLTVNQILGVIGSHDLKLNAVALLLSSIEHIHDFSGIVVSVNRGNYILLCVKKGSMLLQKVVSIEKIHDLYYLISSIRYSFLDSGGSIIIESSMDFFTHNLSFFQNYFSVITHWYKPVTDFCIGMDTTNLVDANCFLLNRLINTENNN